jgi:competence protein ComEC
MTDSPLVWIAAAAVSGILLDRLLPIPPELWFLLLLVLAGTWLAIWLLKLDRPAGFLLLATTASVFGLHHQIYWQFYPPNEIAFFAQPFRPMVCLRGMVVEEPRLRPPPPVNPMHYSEQVPTTVVGLNAMALRDGQQWLEVTGRVSLYIPGESNDLRAGDVVEVFGDLYGLEAPSNPGEPDYREGRRAWRRLCVVSVPFPACVKRIDRTPPRTLPLLLGRIRGYYNRLLHRVFSPEHAPVVTALLLGIRDGVDPELSAAFLETGTLHLLAISGLHVGLLATIFSRGSALFCRRWRSSLVITIVAIMGYLLLAESRPSILRAGTLVLLGCLASWQGRYPLDANVLAATALVVLAVNPIDLFRPGAHLTFLATIAVIGFPYGPLAPKQPSPQEWLYPPRPYLPRYVSDLWNAVRKILLLNLWVWLLVTPYIAWHFHVVSSIAPVLTLFLLPLLVVILLSAIGTVLVDLICPPLVAVLAIPGDLAGSVFCWLAEAGRRVPYGFFWTPGPPAWWTAGFYAVLVVASALPYKFRKRLGTVIVIIWIVVGLVTPFVAPKSRNFRCTFLSVGHGLFVVLQPPEGPAILYDAGSTGNPFELGGKVSEVLWWLGVRQIGAVILSHPDRDHYNLLPEIVRRFPVQKVFVGPTWPKTKQENNQGFSRSDAAESFRYPIELPNPPWARWIPPLHWSGKVPYSWHERPLSNVPTTRDGSPWPEPGVAALTEILDQMGIPIEILQQDDLLTVKGTDLQLRVLLARQRASDLGSPSKEDNANSLVMLAEYGPLRILLTADLEPPGTTLLLQKSRVPCHVMLAPHHGSRSSNPGGLLTWANPEVVVISGGARWFRPDVLTEYYRAGVSVFHTRLDGAVCIESGPSNGSRSPIEQTMRRRAGDKHDPTSPAGCCHNFRRRRVALDVEAAAYP